MPDVTLTFLQYGAVWHLEPDHELLTTNGLIEARNVRIRDRVLIEDKRGWEALDVVQVA